MATKPPPTKVSIFGVVHYIRHTDDIGNHHTLCNNERGALTTDDAVDCTECHKIVDTYWQDIVINAYVSGVSPANARALILKTMGLTMNNGIIEEMYTLIKQTLSANLNQMH